MCWIQARTSSTRRPSTSATTWRITSRTSSSWPRRTASTSPIQSVSTVTDNPASCFNGPTPASFIFSLQTSPIIHYVLCQTTQIFTSWTSYFWDFEVCSSCLDSKITDHTLGGFSISLVEFAGYNDEFNMNSSILGKNLWNLKYLWLNSLSR